ncbi:MAG: hypothetical protein JWP11_1307 [Frankiales bacterium]|nr:hypothetical protein [Frankiales bacterium]
MTDPLAGTSHGPRLVLDLAEDDSVLTVEVSVTIDGEETGHVYLTIERRPEDWDEGEKAKPVERLSADFDGTNATKIAEALLAAVAWGQEYLS